MQRTFQKIENKRLEKANNKEDKQSKKIIRWEPNETNVCV